MLGVSGQAMAAFNEGDLIRVVYNTGANGTGTEYATDLGAFSSTTPLTGNNLLTGTDKFSLGSVSAGSWSNVNVAYFIEDFNANPTATGQGSMYTSGQALIGGHQNQYAYYNAAGQIQNTLTAYQNAAGTASSIALLQTNGSSYWNSMNGGGSGVGTMAGFLNQTTNDNAEKNLAGLSSAGYVDQVLYWYGLNPDSNSQGSRGTVLGTIRTFADGSTQLIATSTATTPIPAAIYLFGSGLVGLVGMRRKISA
jgi:hypothetical protein